MGKAILLVRVSTERQSFDAQEQELFQLAIADGYSENNIIPICEKESGIKLKEEERKGLNAMKELIESDSSIDCVYAWEISRIARKKKILFSILEYLTDRKIQLIIKDPYLKLLLPTGEIDQNAEMVFTLFAQMAESEMRNKAARFKRAKDEMIKNYQYRGGWLPLGYKVDNGYIVIDEEQASIVRLIFSLYIEGVSSYKMSKELESRGYELKLTTIRHILANKNYCSGLYPMIISKEMWNQKCDVAKANDRSVDKSRSNIYFASKLIKCPCGRSYIAYTSTATYLCVGKYHQNGCNNTKGISINAMDSLLWYIAKKEYSFFLAYKNQETIKKLTEEKIIWEQKLNALDKLYQKIDTKLGNISFLLSDAAITKEVYIARKAKILAEKTEIDNNAINYQSEIDRINSILSTEHTTENKTLQELVDNYLMPIHLKQQELLTELDKLSDERKYDIIHQYIKSVEIEHIDVCNKNIIVTYNGFIGLEKEALVKYKSRGKRDKAFSMSNDEMEDFKYFERIKPTNRKDYKDRQEYFVNYQRKLREKRK